MQPKRIKRNISRYWASQGAANLKHFLSKPIAINQKFCYNKNIEEQEINVEEIQTPNWFC